MRRFMILGLLLTSLVACDRTPLPPPSDDPTPAAPAQTPVVSEQPKTKSKTKATSPAPNTPLYANGFEQYKLASEPDDWLLDGAFTIEQFQDKPVLKLSPTSVSDFVALANPELSDEAIENLLITSSRSGQIRARIHTLRKGRRLYSRFGVGLGGDEGFKLLIAANAGRLQLWHNEKVLNEIPFEWISGKWAELNLVVFPRKPGEWVVQGKAWQGDLEPAKWMVGVRVKTEPTVGRPALWGTPYAGKPIYFDDVKVSAYRLPQ